MEEEAVKQEEVENAPIVDALDPAVSIRAEGQAEPTIMGFVAGKAKNPWLCPNGHLIGLIVRKKASHGGNFARLYVLRMAFHPEQIVPETFIFAAIDSGVVACSICGAHREWAPSKEFLAQVGGGSRKKK